MLNNIKRRSNHLEWLLRLLGSPCTWLRRKAWKQMTENPSDDYDCTRREAWSFSPLELTDEGADEGDRWVSQKDHLSCVRGSMEREGDSEGGWLLLSSPFKLFLHTGHVSCCIHREEEHTADDISSGLFRKDIFPNFTILYSSIISIFVRRSPTQLDDYLLRLPIMSHKHSCCVNFIYKIRNSEAFIQTTSPHIQHFKWMLNNNVIFSLFQT